jgi:hypothetical protein
MGKGKAEEDGWATIRKQMPRWGFDGLRYFEICREAWRKMKQMEAELAKLRDSQPPNRKSLGSPGGPHRAQVTTSLDEEARDQECVAIAFAAMCLEACIWDYAACHKSKSYTENHLERLNFVSKWVIIPELLCGSDITKVRIDGKCLMDELNKLRRARNALVHARSKPTLPPNTEELFEALRPERGIAPEDALRLIQHLLGELEKVDKTNWWFFKSDAYRDIIKKIHESSST